MRLGHAGPQCAKGTVLSHADYLQGLHTLLPMMGMYCCLLAIQSILQGGDKQALHIIQDFCLVPNSSVSKIKHQLRLVLQTLLPAISMQ